MKWYLHPQDKEFTSWQPRRMAKDIPVAVSLRAAEPQEAISGNGWAVYPLTDDGPQPNPGQVVNERTISVDAQAGTATAEYTYAVRPLADRKAAMIRQIEALRDAEMVKTVYADINGDESLVINVQMRPQDRANVDAICLNALSAKVKGVTAAVIPFRDEDNVTHLLTPQQMVDMGECCARRGGLVYQRSWDLKAMVDDAADHDDLDDVAAVMEQDWPPQATTPPTAE